MRFLRYGAGVKKVGQGLRITSMAVVSEMVSVDSKGEGEGGVGVWVRGARGVEELARGEED